MDTVGRDKDAEKTWRGRKKASRSGEMGKKNLATGKPFPPGEEKTTVV